MSVSIWIWIGWMIIMGHVVKGKRIDPFPKAEMNALNVSTQQVKKFYQSRRLLEEQLHANGERHHHHSWKAYEEVDGLKNTEVAIFITSTTNGNEHFLWERYAQYIVNVCESIFNDD